MPRPGRALFVLALVSLSACSSGSPTRMDQGRSIASQAGLPAEVGDLFALALDGTNATYRLTYATTDASGAQVQIAVAQKPPNRRIDVYRADGSIESTFRLGDTAYQCTMPAGAASDDKSAWACGKLGSATASAGSPADQLSADTIKAAIDRFRQRAQDYDFSVDSRSVAGVTAKCLVTTRKPGHDQDPALGATATMCVSPEGAIVSVEVPTGSYTATGYATMLPPEMFDLPSPPDQAQTSSS